MLAAQKAFPAAAMGQRYAWPSSSCRRRRTSWWGWRNLRLLSCVSSTVRCASLRSSGRSLRKATSTAESCSASSAYPSSPGRPRSCSRCCSRRPSSTTAPAEGAPARRRSDPLCALPLTTQHDSGLSPSRQSASQSAAASSSRARNASGTRGGGGVGPPPTPAPLDQHPAAARVRRGRRKHSRSGRLGAMPSTSTCPSPVAPKAAACVAAARPRGPAAARRALSRGGGAEGGGAGAGGGGGGGGRGGGRGHSRLVQTQMKL